MASLCDLLPSRLGSTIWQDLEQLEGRVDGADLYKHKRCGRRGERIDTISSTLSSFSVSTANMRLSIVRCAACEDALDMVHRADTRHLILAAHLLGRHAGLVPVDIAASHSGQGRGPNMRIQPDKGQSRHRVKESTSERR